MAKNMDMRQRVEIELDFPVQLADRMLDRVVMRRPVIGDLVDYPVQDTRDMKGELQLYAELCNLNPEELRLVDAADYDKIQKQFISFRYGSKEE